MNITTAEEARVAAKKLNAYCVKLPLLRDYIQYRDSHPPGVPYFNNSAWHARGEQLLLAGTLSGAAIGPSRWPSAEPPVTFGDMLLDPTVSFEERAIHLAIQVVRATPFLWSHVVVQTIIASPPLPSHVISPSILPHDPMFWTFESSYPLRVIESSTGDERMIGSINWLLLFKLPGGVAVVWDETNAATLHWHIFGGILHTGQRYPEEGQPAANLKQFTITDLAVKCLAFLRSPYIHADAERISRPVRRRCAVVSAIEAEKKVHVVTLRRPHAAAVGEAATAGTEWKHQWWVQGHFRAQWYAAEKAHHVIWIEPHMKGPTDKPILEKVYAVKR